MVRLVVRMVRIVIRMVRMVVKEPPERSQYHPDGDRADVL